MRLSKFNSTHSEAVIELFDNVFTDSEGLEEGRLIKGLVADLINTTGRQDLRGFVAEQRRRIIGAIFFSRFSLAKSTGAFILSPVAVSTHYQGRGVGQRLITFGIQELKEQGAELIFTYGDINFYSRFGFHQISEGLVKAPLKLTYPEGWLALSLSGEAIDAVDGDTECVEALNKQVYW